MIWPSFFYVTRGLREVTTGGNRRLLTNYPSPNYFFIICISIIVSPGQEPEFFTEEQNGTEHYSNFLFPESEFPFSRPISD